MPAGQWILIHVPTIAVGVIMLVISAGVAVGGLLIVRRYAPPHKLKGHHDIAGPIFATIGVIYAVLLAFVTIVVYEQFDSAKANLTMEANTYGQMYRTALGFPEPFRSDYRKALNEFADAIMQDEWHAQAYAGPSARVAAAAKQVNAVFARYEPSTEKEMLYYEQILDKMNVAGELRRQRLLDQEEALPSILWAVLILGGLITVAFTFFFGSDNMIAQHIMTIMVAVLIALVLFTIFVLDFPFTGDLRVPVEPLEQMVIQGRY